VDIEEFEADLEEELDAFMKESQRLEEGERFLDASCSQCASFG